MSRRPFDIEGFHERVYHARPPALGPVRIGAAVIVLIALFAYLAVFKSVPFTGGGYEVNALFEDAGTIVPGSPVRIAGIEVGEVREIEPVDQPAGAESADSVAGESMARVTFTVDDAGRPVRSDATATIRPRLFLEGNLFIDLSPGSPGAEELADGGTIPVTRTARAVQFDEVLSTLTKPARENLRRLLGGFGSALESAAPALNDALAHSPDATRTSALLSRAMRGRVPGDLGRLVDDGSDVLAVLATRDDELRELVTNLNVTAGALAGESASLRQAIAELDPTLREATPALRAVDRTVPPLREFARELTPSVAELPGMIEAGRPWLRQAGPLLGGSELGGIVAMLGTGTPGLAAAGASLDGLFSGLEQLSRCATDVLIPTADAEISDPFSVGVPSYAELFYGAVAQAGEGASFDGNGPWLRVQAGGGPVRVSGANPNGGLNNEVIYGNAIRPPLGTQPVLADRPPPVRYDVDCEANVAPDLNGPAATPGPPSPEATP